MEVNEEKVTAINTESKFYMKCLQEIERGSFRGETPINSVHVFACALVNAGMLRGEVLLLAVSLKVLCSCILYVGVRRGCVCAYDVDAVFFFTLFTEVKFSSGTQSFYQCIIHHSGLLVSSTTGLPQTFDRHGLENLLKNVLRLIPRLSSTDGLGK